MLARTVLAFETLESRLPLAITVDTLVDEADGSITDGDISLRDAIAAAADGETILFSLSGTIALTLGQLPVGKSLTIHGPGAEQLTIDASASDPTPNDNLGDGTRVFDIDDGNLAATSIVTLRDLTLTGGDAAGAGGAIRSVESLTLENCRVTGNWALSGGGIHLYAPQGALVIADSVINNNVAQNGAGIESFGPTTVTRSAITGNSGTSGAGIANVGGLTVEDSVVSGNVALSNGGGIHIDQFSNYEPATLSVVRSTVSGNTALNRGGGIYGNRGAVNVTASLVSENTAGAAGGGVFARYGAILIADSTIWKNSAGYGGGLRSSYNNSVTLAGSTITGNSATTDGGGLFVQASATLEVDNSTIVRNMAANNGGGIMSPGLLAQIRNSLIANNTRGEQERNDFTGAVSLAFSLLSVTTDALVDDLIGNLLGSATEPLEPRLGPLSYNGGAIPTHALLPDSPAINAGDPAAQAGVDDIPLFDQRGAPWSRVADQRIDIGAFEAQPNPLPGDYNFDNLVDAADYAVWRRNLGSTTELGADGSGNGIVDDLDHGVWAAQFGKSLPSPAVASGPSPAIVVARQAAIDSAITTPPIHESAAPSGFLPVSDFERPPIGAAAFDTHPSSSPARPSRDDPPQSARHNALLLASLAAPADRHSLLRVVPGPPVTEHNPSDRPDTRIPVLDRVFAALDARW